MATDVKCTQAQQVDAALAALQHLQAELVRVKGHLAAVTDADDPGYAHAAHKATKTALAHAKTLEAATRQCAVDADVAWLNQA